MVVFGINVVFQKHQKTKNFPYQILDAYPGGVQRIPFVVIGDDAFALKTHMIKPYPQRNMTTERRVYNYRHSRGRRISENLFGIQASRLRICHTVMLLEPTAAESVIFCHFSLITLMASSAKNIYCPKGLCRTGCKSGFDTRHLEK